MSGPNIKKKRGGGRGMPENGKKRRAPTALCRECGVCTAPAPDHLHFGGHCCYSCRAFFRRTIERMERMDIVCRTGDNLCEVNENSKSCSSCRYQKCLEIGMKRELLQGKRKNTAPPIKRPKKKKTASKIQFRKDRIEDDSTTSNRVTTPGICTIPDYGRNFVKTSVIQAPSNLKTDWMIHPSVESPIKTEQTVIKSDPPILSTLNEMYHDYVVNQDPRNGSNEVSVIVSDSSTSTAPKIQNQALKEAHNLLDTNSFNRILEDLYRGGSAPPPPTNLMGLQFMNIMLRCHRVSLSS